MSGWRRYWVIGVASIGVILCLVSPTVDPRAIGLMAFGCLMVLAGSEVSR